MTSLYSWHGSRSRGLISQNNLFHWKWSKRCICGLSARMQTATEQEHKQVSRSIYFSVVMKNWSYCRLQIIYLFLTPFESWHLELLKLFERAYAWTWNNWFEFWQPWIKINQKRLRASTCEKQPMLRKMHFEPVSLNICFNSSQLPSGVRSSLSWFCQVTLDFIRTPFTFQLFT